MVKTDIDFNKMNGLIPVIVQDYKTKDVLMLGFMNKEAFDKTNETGKVTFWSRTQKKLWTKGETSGNFLIVKRLFMDCDDDTLLVMAEPKGPTCHTGNKTCFFKELK
jgi:phosphoribosyl-AMP cyclohydrolase